MQARLLSLNVHHLTKFNEYCVAWRSIQSQCNDVDPFQRYLSLRQHGSRDDSKPEPLKDSISGPAQSGKLFSNEIFLKVNVEINKIQLVCINSIYLSIFNIPITSIDKELS